MKGCYWRTHCLALPACLIFFLIEVFDCTSKANRDTGAWGWGQHGRCCMGWGHMGSLDVPPRTPIFVGTARGLGMGDPA